MTAARALGERPLDADALARARTRWLTAGLAHDLNNALCCLFGELDVLAEELEIVQRASRPESVSEAANLLRVLAGCVGSLASIDAALQTARRYGRGLEAVLRGDPPTPAPSSVELRVAVERSLALSAASLRDTHVSTSIGPVEVAVSEDALVRVLSNLISNARQAFPGMQGDRRVQIVSRTAEARVSCDVADNGPGVAPEILPRLFEHFATTKAPGRGSGIGLASSRDLMRAVGGDLALAETSARGSVFRITLPTARKVSL